MTTTFDFLAAEKFLKQATGMLGKDKESPLRHLLSAHLPQMFPGAETPWWIHWHARGAETRIRSERQGKEKRGFIDTLVGSTAIEYERDLTDAALAVHGEDQVREYCAGLLNRGVPAANIEGILSDTVRWQAFRIQSVLPKTTGDSLFGERHVVLEQIEAVDLSNAGKPEAELLLRFLCRYLGRLGGRVLGADTLAADLGFDSDFCTRHLDGIRLVVDQAFASNPKYADLIEKIWCNFVAYLGDSGSSGQFDRDTYVGELYVLTLAKLLCADVLQGTGLVSDDAELESVLDGSFFQARGFSNLVEYDYFGWLNQGGYVTYLLPVARDIQRDLAAYDFAAAPAEDVFGSLMAQLARRSQRLLLGQEWTPAWLARYVVEKVLSRLPDGQDPRFIDMCCGSGSMVVETVKQTRARFEVAGVTADAASVSRLSQAVTGFDVDPMAVMLAKVSWVLAAREWLLRAGAFDVTIPIYHADSLFSSTPVAKKVDADGAERHILDLDGRKVSLPRFLISPENVTLFDAVISSCSGLAMEAAKSNPPETLSGWPERIFQEACEKTGKTLGKTKATKAIKFASELLSTLEALQRAGRNGIWAFVLGNSYRPGLVSGIFNGLVSNPPWLAMSKVANNPYKESLVEIAERHGIKPRGASHLHAEMATIFLLQAISRYLTEGAAVGCVLPESVTSAHHHNPFRRGEYLTAEKSVQFSPEELWRVESGTFKNEAIVLFGTKTAAKGTLTLVGSLATPDGLSELPFYVISQGTRTAWSNKPGSNTATGFFEPAPFKQGADVFPRTAIFHDVRSKGVRYDISPIQRPNSQFAYLVNDAKNYKDFTITAAGVAGKFLFDVLMSNHLTPFRLEPPAKGLLPLEKKDGEWRPASKLAIQAAGASTAKAFSRFFKVTGGTSEAFFDSIDTPRRKLASQVFPSRGWLVVMGAGGKLVCAAHQDIADFDKSKLIIDQTLYWVVVPTEDEALYLSGLLNSEAVNVVIQQFQPRGQFGERHVHTLPLGVTPKFNPLDSGHMDVVAKTRAVIEQWHADEAMYPSVFASIRDLNQRLSRRRTNLRERLKELPAYPAYDFACRNLYSV